MNVDPIDTSAQPVENPGANRHVAAREGDGRITTLPDDIYNALSCAAAGIASLSGFGLTAKAEDALQRINTVLEAHRPAGDGEEAVNASTATPSTHVAVTRELLGRAARVINFYLEPDSPDEHEALWKELTALAWPDGSHGIVGTPVSHADQRIAFVAELVAGLRRAEEKRKRGIAALPPGTCTTCMGEGYLGSIESQRVTDCPDCVGGRSD